MSDKKTCFFISPIGKEGSDERKRSDDVLEYIISPVADKLGYEVIRADQIGKPGMITSQIIQYVLEADLVIADLAYRNPNVFYELALRHAIRKPFIQLIEEGAAIPFDVAGLRTIHLDHKDLGSAERAKGELTRQIESIHREPKNVESPVTQAIDVQRLRQSGGEVEESLAVVMDMLSDLKGQIAQFSPGVAPTFSLSPGVAPTFSIETFGQPLGTLPGMGLHRGFQDINRSFQLIPTLTEPIIGASESGKNAVPPGGPGGASESGKNAPQKHVVSRADKKDDSDK